MGEVLARATRKVGTRDTVITGNTTKLKKGLRCCFTEALDLAQVSEKDIAFAVASGMITSEIGLIEIPHIWAPTSTKNLAKNMKRIVDDSTLPMGIPFYFIRGVKNQYNPATATMKEFANLDFMRGEETQVAGFLSDHEGPLPLIIIVLSSHTKFIFLDTYRNISGGLTTLSGQMFEAIENSTSIAKSITPASGDSESDGWDEEVIDIASECVATSGLLRACLIPRFFDVMIDTKWYERRLFLEASLAYEDLKILESIKKTGFHHEAECVLIGQKTRCRLYEYLLQKQCKSVVLKITETKDIDMLIVKGQIFLAKEAGIIK
jgi:2-dehydro-3-deoxygalactonokinase